MNVDNTSPVLGLRSPQAPQHNNHDFTPSHTRCLPAFAASLEVHWAVVMVAAHVWLGKIMSLIVCYHVFVLDNLIVCPVCHAGEVFPKMPGRIACTEVSTPLSTERFSRWPKGSM